MHSSHPRQAPGAPRARRTRVPPALTRGPEAMPALGIVEEVPGDLGVVLWQSARNVALWAATPVSRRGALFSGAAADARAGAMQAVQLDSELVAPLSVMVRLLECPAAMDVVRVVNACRRVALWAEQRGLLATALEFTQAAAQAAPQIAGLAYAVGRLARRRAEYDRAESWYARAIVQARRGADWRMYARSYSGLGNLFVQRGNFPAARRAHSRCLRAARRHGLGELEGDALHDLFVLAFETGAAVDAEALARSALEAYGPGNPKTLRLAYDIAYFWTLGGRFAEALRVARAILPHMTDEEERMVVTADVARAAGGMGSRREFREAAAATWAMAERGTARDAAARALLGVAHGAASLGDWAEAERALTVAAAYAAERRESKIQLTAEAMLESVRAERATQAASAPAPEEEGSFALAAELVTALERVPAGA